MKNRRMHYKKLYCKHCGRKLSFIERKVAYYDWITGEPTYEKNYRCPKIGFFGKLVGSVHSEMRIIEGRGLDGKYRETILATFP